MPGSPDNLFRAILSSKSEVTDFTRRLVRIPTVNPPGDNYEEIAGVICKKILSMGLKVRTHRTPGSILAKAGIDARKPRPSVVADWDTGSKKTVHINGHFDVVPVTSSWHRDPFSAELAGGAIHGRGSEDMKGTIAAYIFAVEALISRGLKPRVNVQLSFTPDEETGGETGFGYLVKSGLVRADYAISEGHSGEFVSCGNKGILWMEVKISGKSCHASVPYAGVNAFEKMLLAGRHLESLKEKIQKRRTRFAVKRREDSHPTLVMGGILSGGNKANIVPDTCTFSVDRRILPEEDLKEAQAEIMKVLRGISSKDKAFSCKVKVLGKSEAVTVGKNEKIVTAITEAVREINGRPARLAITPGANDMRYLADKGVPCVGYSAHGASRWHGDDEFVKVSSILQTAAVIAATLMRLD